MFLLHFKFCSFTVCPILLISLRSELVNVFRTGGVLLLDSMVLPNTVVVQLILDSFLSFVLLLFNSREWVRVP